MSFNEPYFAPISNYSKKNSGMPMEQQEAWLDQFPQKRAENKPNHGIIRSIADTRELFLREMPVSERKAARDKAQREHRKALKNLAKQEAQDAKEIAKQLTVWRRESKKNRTPKKDGAELTVIGQQFLDTLKSQGFYETKNFPKSKTYMQKIVRQIKAMGYQIEAERKSIVIVRYVLSNKKP